MAAKSKKQPAKHTTKRRATEAIFEAYGLPGWLGWGTAGAESTYGTNGPCAFGGIDLPNSCRNDYWVEARESAKAYKGLVKKYGSVEAAIPHYSGNSYTIAHVKELAGGGGSTAGEVVDVNLLEDIPGVGPSFKLFEEAGGAVGIPNPIEKGAEALGEVSGLGALAQPFITISETFKVVGELLFTPSGWLRIGKLIGGAIFLVWGIEQLIQASGPDVAKKGSGLVKDAAIAAVVK